MPAATAVILSFGAVALGYLAMAGTVLATFAVAYFALGTDAAFQPGGYEVSALWLVVSTVLSIGAAVLGGFVCRRVGRSVGPVMALAVVVLVLGLAMAIPMLTGDPAPATVRDASVGSIEAMTQARQPTWVALLTPFLGAVFVLVGGRLGRRGDEEDA